MFSDKIKSAIERLSDLSPAAKNIATGLRNELESVSEDLGDSEDMSNQELIQDNIKLKNLVLSLSGTVSSLENTIENLISDLEILQDAAGPAELSNKIKASLRKYVEESSVSYLSLVYKSPQTLANMSKPARAFLCSEMIDRFTERGSADKIPQVWHNIVSTDGEI